MKTEKPGLLFGKFLQAPVIYVHTNILSGRAFLIWQPITKNAYYLYIVVVWNETLSIPKDRYEISETFWTPCIIYIDTHQYLYADDMAITNNKRVIDYRQQEVWLVALAYRITFTS